MKFVLMNFEGVELLMFAFFIKLFYWFFENCFVYLI